MANNVRIAKQANKFLVLDCIRKFEPVSQDVIVEITGLSRPTVAGIMKELEEQEMIIRTGYGDSAIGRSPVLYGLNANTGYAIGIDFEYPTVRILIANLKLEVKNSVKWSYRPQQSPDEIMDVLCLKLGELIKASAIPKESIVGIGVGLPGIVDMESGVSVFIERIPNWADVSVKEILERRFDIPVFVRNDSHMLVLTEASLNFAEYKQLIYIGLRSHHGIGMALVLNGEVFEGFKGNAGFLGHVTVDPNGRECYCGRRGCLETYVGSAAIEKFVSIEKQNKSAAPTVTDDVDKLSLYDLVKVGMEGNPNAVAVLNDSGKYFGLWIANLIKIFEIPNIIIGGLPPDCDFFTKSIFESVRANLYKNMADEVEIMQAKCEEKLYPIGACLLVLNKYFIEPNLVLYV